MQKALGGQSGTDGYSALEQNKPRVIRGKAMTLGEFQARYGLESGEAKRLFDRFGPSALELDLLMQAKNKPAVLPDPSERPHA